MDQVMDILKLSKFNFLKNDTEKFGQQRKNLDRRNKSLEYKVEKLKDLNNVCECIIALYSFRISKEKMDQVS